MSSAQCRPASPAGACSLSARRNSWTRGRRELTPPRRRTESAGETTTRTTRTRRTSSTLHVSVNDTCYDTKDSGTADRPAQRAASRPSCCTQSWTLDVINWLPTTVASCRKLTPLVTVKVQLRMRNFQSVEQSSSEKYPYFWRYRDNRSAHCTV